MPTIHLQVRNAQMAPRLDEVVAQIRNLECHSADCTNWIALSGAPGSGKSTILEKLRDRGYVTHSERARMIIEGELALGKNLDIVSQDPGYLVEQIFDANLALAYRSSRLQQAVFDRSLPDVLAFGLVDGVNIERYIAKTARFRFHSVFIFERLSRTNDRTLYHNEEQRRAIEHACIRIYEAFGARITHIPAMSSDPNESLRLRLEMIERLLD